MGALIDFPGAQSPVQCARPSVFTEPVVARFAQSNHVARKLRQLGYHVIDEDVCPDDDGSPIIQIAPPGAFERSLRLLAGCVTTTPEVVRLQIEGVRVFWHRGP